MVLSIGLGGIGIVIDQFDRENGKAIQTYGSSFTLNRIAHESGDFHIDTSLKNSINRLWKRAACWWRKLSAIRRIFYIYL